MSSDNNHSTVEYDKNRATPATDKTKATVEPVFNGPVGTHVEHDTIAGGFTITGRKNKR